MSTDFFKMRLSNLFLWLVAWRNDIVEMGNCTRWYVCFKNAKILFGNRREFKLWDMFKKLFFSLNKCVFLGKILTFIYEIPSYYISQSRHTIDALLIFLLLLQICRHCHGQHCFPDLSMFDASKKYKLLLQNSVYII